MIVAEQRLMLTVECFFVSISRFLPALSKQRGWRESLVSHLRAASGHKLPQMASRSVAGDQRIPALRSQI
jgi:hypothetical protein